MKASTNLAGRPFRNERLPWLFAGCLAALALVASFLHGRFAAGLLSRDEGGTVSTVRADEARIAEIEGLLASEPPIRIEAAEQARLLAFKDLVDRRAFPWRRLLLELETTLSEDVRLTRISPSNRRQGRGLPIQIAGEARSKDAAFSWAEGLDASPAFSMAALRSLSENDGVVEFEIEVAFDPETGAGPVRRAALPVQGGP